MPPAARVRWSRQTIRALIQQEGEMVAVQNYRQ